MLIQRKITATAELLRMHNSVWKELHSKMEMGNRYLIKKSLVIYWGMKTAPKRTNLLFTTNTVCGCNLSKCDVTAREIFYVKASRTRGFE